ncbi:bifunctional methionine sulfoxide reductase B/A protein [Thiotrichales bacterium 19S3-7]|nr:bifunctional methionine sulfoxide reductase B/A protein [Thiotrichales bacterium 19S3-7]MCF6801540.1 bifunctional methionine sulfoxide reductase B/A protein [Thiotrichales bacterium 19S3-11]
MDKTDTLTPILRNILIDKGTEPPNSGNYNLLDAKGTYLCRRCGLALFRSDSKFISSCGWPSFDDEMTNAIKRQPDADGRRTEILCNRCDGHLGHVFHDEGYTEKNLRHCVNSLSVEFVENVEVVDTEEAIFAGGCFWGVEHLLKQQEGVLITEVGYTAGKTNNPSYQEVCQGTTGHIEAVRCVYDPNKTSFRKLAKLFLEIHDPTQRDGQGPDIGEQYKSIIFYFNDTQKQTAKDLLNILRNKGFDIVTELVKATVFWPAEDYHQAYYIKTGKTPYCHRYTKRFD